MDNKKLHDEAMETLLSDKAIDIISEIGAKHDDPNEAAIIGFSYGLLTVRDYIDTLFDNKN